MLRLALIAATMVATPAAAQYYAPLQPAPRTVYDWQSGNSYRVTPQPDGSTRIRGSNLNTGSTWSTTVQPDGSQRGTDSRGNMWRQSPSGTYMNLGTGRICTGRGMARICN